ncbi:hypothetical protein K9U39_18420 [Rhodoblastus acidophilus]|uniref:Uncharacterized protein n=1 Tax=Candidatus Rhodoblastus alkanivorans TaxID=2954117 RepID=A0ABS9Z2D4_9HYPH|nr:hypothetical protein [Candidatus Rhodoblastus alkanivorans]MCI4677475.1 hypothetical protein [Candidatus Rhodoblastus alkanivorans]MCI4681834.1 hypothetical protein [Candidatus Rhodoblastus alkanivorans]MDI4642884.1 hypothetical protein [Rhodoblastus acidophilus]
MNTANLQLEGVYIVLASLLEALVAKGAFDQAELVAILSDVERRIGADSSRPVEIRESNVEAAQFPARFLKSALRASSDGRKPSFAEIVSLIKESRRPEGAPAVSP